MSAIRDFVVDAWKQADHMLLALCVSANLFGVILIYSSSQWKASMHGCPVKQVIAMVLGIFLYFVVSQLNIDSMRNHWKLCVAFGTFLVLLLLVPGLYVSVHGNRAWLKFPGIPFNVQPAEVDKIFFAVLLSQVTIFFKRQKKLNSIPSVIQICGVLFYFVGLIFGISHDAGSCLIYLFIFIFVLWAAGLSKIWFAIGFAAMGFGGRFLWLTIDETEGPLTRLFYMKKRIMVCLDHTLDPQGAGFQQTRAMQAIRSGGLTGQGFMKGVLTQSHYASALTPERNSDLIFASCAEEWGLMGCSLVIILLGAIILRCIYIGLTAPDEFSSLVCLGYSGMMIGQISLNLGMCLFVMPVIGVTLPFFSYGGSSIITNYVIMGIVSGVKNRKLPDWLKSSNAAEVESSGVYLKPQNFGVNYKRKRRFK